MRFPSVFVVLALLAAPAAAADDIAPLLPERTVAVIGIDVKEVMTSPLGKKVFGTDKRSTVITKLASALLESALLDYLLKDTLGDYLKTLDKSAREKLVKEFVKEVVKALEPFKGLVDKIERVTIAFVPEREDSPYSGPLRKAFGETSMIVFLEGPNSEEDYRNVLESILKALGEQLEVKKIGGRNVLPLPLGQGISLSKSLFVIAENQERLTDVLDRYDGKKKLTKNEQLVDAMKRVKPTDTPIWIVHGRESRGLAVGTFALKDDVDFRYEYKGDNGLGNFLVGRVEGELDSAARLIPLAKLTVQRKGNVVTATGTIPGKRLAEEYAKQK